MAEINQQNKEQEAPFSDWQKMAQDFLNPFVNQWSNLFQESVSEKKSPLKGRVAESLYSNLKMWQTLLGAMSGPDTMQRFQKATEMSPDLALGFALACLQSMNGLQTHVLDWIQKRGESLSEADVQELDRDLLKSWRDIYEQEFSRYLKIPQLGLGRLYQEKGLNAMDKLNLFQLELAGFLHMLYLPIEKSLKSLQEEMTAMAEEGNLDENSKAYYKFWIKSMEGYYMELFQKEEYSEAMHKTLFALHEFSDAKQGVINDVLKQLNVPTNQDIDELSKEIYLLKKRVRALEKK